MCILYLYTYMFYIIYKDSETPLQSICLYTA